MRPIFSWFWHDVLKRPYRLACPIDVGEGVPVVLLHGVATSSATWSGTVEALGKVPVRVLGFDLLGFGVSPKPERSSYDVKAHAAAVAQTIWRLHIRQPVVLVGHSMGCLIAVELAKAHPKLVRKMILYEAPLYEGLPARRRYNLRRDLYYAMYRRIVKHPHYSPANVRALQKIVVRAMGFVDVSRETWNAFVRSLRNTIMAQTALNDLRQLKTPTELIYGSRDIVVIRGKPQNFFGADAQHITAHTIAETHGISPKAATFLAGRVGTAIGLSEAEVVSRLPNYKRYLKSPKTKIFLARSRRKKHD